jgi:NAD(P)-dependent dehydrogenase (short-subunit alcohol dehydrogenase family)
MTAQRQANDLLKYETRPERCPTARPGQAEEMADVIVFMLSEKASYVNGTTWQADGGLLAT